MKKDIDIDSFRRINDNSGHDVGDSVLRTISRVIVNKFGTNEVICRLGGDEFGVFVPRVEDKITMARIMGEICDEAVLTLNNQGEKIIVSCSIGGVMIDDARDDFKHIYPKADKALLKVKQNGKNGYFIYDGTR